ncbi:ionotropic receptor 75a-like [Danaus plexippus]|uniref:ionotropic receptor 75a-like n=1 Tax=Danaus plexippus TaxID=13037 RepID=UPI002AAFA397|nr:ionotropic receptor 75a-like [Danaus plexippus]
MDLFYFIFLLNSLHAMASPVIIDILKLKSIQNCIIFNCNENHKAKSLQKVLLKNNFRILTVKSDFKSKYFSHYGHSKIGFVLDTSCDFWYVILDKIDTQLLGGSHTWLVQTDDLSGTVSLLSKYPIEVNSDFIIISKDIKRSNMFYLHEIYNKGFYTNGSSVVKSLGYFESRLTMKRNSRIDLSGVVLKCVVVVLDPIVNQTFKQYLDNAKPGIVDSLHKLKFYVLLKYLEDLCKFRYKLERTNSWGYLRNGSFDGMVGALQRREADIGGTPIFYRPDRARFVDYTTPTWQSRPCFILRHPKYPGGFYSIYTRPLTTTVWYSIIGLVSLAGTMLCVMLKLNLLKEPGDDEDSSTSMAFLFIFSALSQQGTTIIRGATSIKVVTFVTFVFSLTLYQYYNATVVSTLLREAPITIKSLKDLLNSNLKAGVEDVLYNKDYFKRTTDPVAIEIYHQKIVTSHHYNFFTPEYGMVLVKRGDFAFHVDSVTAYRIMRQTFSEREICDAHEIQLFPPQNMVAALPKNSPYKEHVTIGIRKIYEAGLMHRLKSVWDEPKPPCVRTPDASIFSVNIREFSMALVLLAFGIALSVAILIGEMIFYTTNMKRIEFRL